MTAPTLRPTPLASSGRLAGVLLAVASSSVFSINTVMARLAFKGGTDAPTLNAVRFLFATLVLLVLFLSRKPRPLLTGRQRLASLGLGIAFFFTSFGYMGAIQYIPVSVAALVLYSYPILVGIVTRFTEGTPLGLLRLAALLLAFVGLALALNVETHALPDWRGLVLALTASLGMVVFVVGSSRALRDLDRGAVNLHLIFASSVLFVVLLPAGGGPAWPATLGGWLALGGTLATFTLGQIALMAALGKAGPVLTATVMNLEPVFTIGLAVLLVDEHLSPRQFLGAAFVVAAISMTGRADANASTYGISE